MTMRRMIQEVSDPEETPERDASGPTKSDLEELPEKERKLFREMRERVKEGARVEFKEDHKGELIAIESVMHRASDFD